MTVPVYIFGAVCFVLQAHFSDKWQLRSPFIIGSFFFQLIGYVLLASIDGPSGVRYFALYVIAVGLYTPVGLNVGWCQNNNAGHYKRAMSVGLMQLIGNSSGAAIGVRTCQCQIENNAELRAVFSSFSSTAHSIIAVSRSQPG